METKLLMFVIKFRIRSIIRSTKHFIGSSMMYYSEGGMPTAWRFAKRVYWWYFKKDKRYLVMEGVVS